MCVNTNHFISLAHQYVAVPISVLGTKGAQLIIELFKQLKDGLYQAVKSLKAYLWKVPINQGAPNQETRNIPAPILQIISASTTTSVPLSSRESGPFTGQLIEASAVLPFLPFELPIEVLTKHLLPHCTATDLHHVLLTNKQYLSLFKDANVLSHLLSELNAVDRTKLMSVVGPYLTDIEIGGPNWTQEQFSEFIPNCPNLTSIHFIKCIQITDHTIKALAQACPHVTSIYFNECEKMTGDTIKTLAQAYPNLTKCRLDKATMVSDDGIEALALGCPNLTHLELYSLGGHMTNKAIEVIAKHCQSLTHIEVRSAAVTSQVVKAFAENGHRLESVTLKLYEGLTHEEIAILVQACPNLTELIIDVRQDQMDEVPQVIAKHLPQLTRLGLCHSKMTDSGVQALVQGCPKLTKLDLYLENMTKEALELIYKNYPDLTDFRICSHSVPVHEMEALLQKLPKLTSLSLGFPQMTEDMIKIMAQNCQNLTMLDLHDAGNRKITDDAVKTIAYHCQKLQSLGLHGHLITRESIQSIAQHCPQIKRLDLSNCYSLTEEDWKILPKKFKKLKHLSITSSSIYNNHPRVFLPVLYPHLHISEK